MGANQEPRGMIRPGATARVAPTILRVGFSGPCMVGGRVPLRSTCISNTHGRPGTRKGIPVPQTGFQYIWWGAPGETINWHQRALVEHADPLIAPGGCSFPL